MFKNKKNIYIAILLTTLISLNWNSSIKAQPNLLNGVFLGEVQTKSDVPSDEITKKYDFNLVQELILGRSVAYALLEKFNNKICTDEKVNKYVNLVGQSIAKSVSKRPQIKYRFGVIDTNEINAFACPGGYIFITTGLLKVINDENELAAILAHEIGHVENGDGLKDINEHRKDEFAKLKVDNLEKDIDTVSDVATSLPYAGWYASYYSPTNMAKRGISSALGSIGGYGGLVASMTVGTASGYAVDAAAKGLKDLVKVFGQKAIERWYYKPLTPEVELVADEYSANALAKIGYSPVGLTGFLETMKFIELNQPNAQAVSTTKGAENVFTYRHPPINERITKIKDLMTKEQTMTKAISPDEEAVFKNRFKENITLN